MPFPEIEEDIVNLTKTQLREKYKSTYSSWKNMKSRRHDGGEVHPKFEDFSSFLKIMGPRPSKNDSLDRIDPNDPEYAPGKVKWSDKTQQANNQSRSIKLEYKGKMKPLTEWCRDFGLKADTVRRRYHNGETAEEILFGKQETARVQNPKRAYHTTAQKWPWLSSRRADEWEKNFIEGHDHLESRYDFFISSAEDELQRIEDELNPLKRFADEFDERDKNHPAVREKLIHWDMKYDDVFREIKELEHRAKIVMGKYEEALTHKEIKGIFHDPMPLYRK